MINACNIKVVRPEGFLHFIGVMFGASAGVRASNGDSGGNVATCWGGSVASGVYGNLKIAGACTVDAGSVTVEHDLTVLPGGSLVASAGGSLTPQVGSDVKVGGNIEVQSNGILVLGCEPIYFICSNDPD
jgi:hypothetical protein